MKKNSKNLKIVEKGFLGSCWYGKYHYVEPWVGCEHGCIYCYAKTRTVIKDVLETDKLKFNQLLNIETCQQNLYFEIAKQIEENKVSIVKLSRYTDILTPSMIQNGRAYKVLKTILLSSVERVIITTKGCPDRKIIDLLKQFKHKVSYCTTLIPQSERLLVRSVASNREKLEKAKIINSLGIKTTVHLDPLSISIFDSDDEWIDLLKEIKSFGLNRVMFSFLILDHKIANDVKESLPEDVFTKLISLFDQEKLFNYTYVDDPVFYIRDDIQLNAIKRLSKFLKSLDFDFVLCGLKNIKESTERSSVGKAVCSICNGDFYA